MTLREVPTLRRFGKQVAGLGFFHQRRRHLAVEMRVAPGLVVERVEDGERGRSLLSVMVLPTMLKLP
jgi:hypothetical protein